MNIKEIEQYLKNQNTTFSSEVLQAIEEHRQAAVQEKDEQLANHCWCLEVIYYIQSGFVSIFNQLKRHRYVEAWEALRQTDIQLTCLQENFPLPEGEEDPYHLTFIKNTLPEYEKLFPFEYFVARESVIKKQRCTICGQEVSLRNNCGHIPNKVYMGEMCMHQIIDMEYLGAVVVRDPFDKFEVLKPYEMDYNYGMLDGLMRSLKSPYEFWFVDVVQEKNPEYAKISRNDKCPCGSGKKFKFCCMNDPKKMYFDHYKIRMMNEPGDKADQTLTLL